MSGTDAELSLVANTEYKDETDEIKNTFQGNLNKVYASMNHLSESEGSRIDIQALNAKDLLRGTSQLPTRIQLLPLNNDNDPFIFKYMEHELTIGRSPSCDYVIQDPKISRSHARIKIKQNFVEIQDNMSDAGTFVNDKRIIRAEIKNNDIVRFGTHKFQVVFLS